MRTGCSLTVCWSLFPRGRGVSAPGCLLWRGWGCLVWGGVWSGGCLVQGGVWSGGSAPNGVSVPGGCLVWGVWSGGVWFGGCLLLGDLVPGVWSGGCLLLGGGKSQHALRTPLRGQTDACENITLAQLRCGRQKVECILSVCLSPVYMSVYVSAATDL